MAIDALPDNVLLETFEFYLGKDDAVGINYNHSYDGWQTLVHVCHKWRCVVFASPRRLDLKLYCTRQRSVGSKTLDIWPAFPTIIDIWEVQSKEDVTNVIATLGQQNRVCKIYYYHWQFQDFLLEEFAAMDAPFPMLTSLKLFSSGHNVPVLPNSFLGGSAPRLRLLDLKGIPSPSISKLLSSTTSLVRLSLWDIPRSGYIAPETIIRCLSMLPRLESLALGFKYPRSRAHRASRHLPSFTRLILLNLTFFGFRGEVEYLEDILSQIETPILIRSDFCFFNQVVFDTPLLGNFIRRTETFKKLHAARVELFSWAVVVTLWGREEIANNDWDALRLEITCKPLDWQLSALSQVLQSFVSSFTTLEHLKIIVSRKDWQGVVEGIQWREFFHPFTFVKKIALAREDSVRLVASGLQYLAGEGATDVLPALQSPFLTAYGWQPVGLAKEAIEQFIATRQLYGHPVNVHY